MIRNRDSITHWTMIWEEEGHHIFINLENKYKYTFSSSWHLTKPWSRSAVSLLQRTQPPSSATQGEDLQGKGVGKESPDSSSITMHKIPVPFSWTSLPLFIWWRRVRGEAKVVTTEGVSCITTQTNSKGVFLCFNVEKQMRDYEGEKPAHDMQVFTRATHEYMHARLVKHETRVSYATMP